MYQINNLYNNLAKLEYLLDTQEDNEKDDTMFICDEDDCQEEPAYYEFEDDSYDRMCEQHEANYGPL